MSGIVTLLGAGELMAATSRLHRAALDRLDEPARPVFIDTAAGFESNAAAITAKAVEYYRHHLQLGLQVASYRHAASASPSETAAAVATIRQANYLFAGPGSPTYAITQWRNSPVLAALIERYEQHAHLFFASAASITMGRYALPVYEIYKAGMDPFWADGVDFLGRLGLDVAVVPHFDDNSGGENYDSRYCYMGASRFDRLQRLLPPEVTILGLDSYTALTIDHHRGVADVSGQGGITVIGERGAERFPSGAAVPLDVLTGGRRDLVTTDTGRQFGGYGYADDATDATANADDLTAFIESLDGLEGGQKVELLARIEGLRATLAAPPPVDDVPLIELILELRQGLRGAKRFDLADRARDVLVAQGYVIGDSAAGSTWSRGAVADG